MKTLIIALNIIAISMVPFLLVGNVYINHDAPQSVDAGSEVEVKITINKGAITGPAKVKIDFSDALGLRAEEISSSGAIFSFSDGVANFTWIAIDAAEIIELKYKIKADASAIGTRTISGKFTYLDEDERRTVSIPSIIIEIKNTNSSVASNNNTNNSEGNNKPVTNPLEISCERFYEKSGNDVLVTLNLSKGNYSGFARIVENIPAGFKAVEVQSAGSVFKFSDDAAKFLWTNIPTDKSFLTLKYKLIPPAGAAGSFSVDGEFSGEFLIINDVPTSVIIKSSSFNIDDLPLANNSTNSSNTTSQANNASQNTAANSNSSNNNSSNSSTNKTPKSNSSSSNTSSSANESASSKENGVKYRVQILAGHNNVSTSSVKKAYSFDEKVSMENHEGWVKYSTGSFSTYKDAKSKRNSLSSFNFPGPFVVAYNNGNRISVQEALAISNQNWVQ